ncbi:relaxase domain-containing protein [Nocardioides sp. NPDC058538]|uniref:relaxase domain-containing protein n=1 Tax=Nocardioides sp. NPDC058538 TaxID=3346542 RepID=UPI003652EE65
MPPRACRSPPRSTRKSQKRSDAAQQDAAREIQRFHGQHSVTLAGPRGAQEVLPIEQMQTVAITHKTSRAGDPHRHIHFQIGTRVWAGGKRRELTTAALFQQQGAIRALGTAVIAAHPQLAQTLTDHGLTLDPVSGEVTELEPFNAVMSKRSSQIRRNLERMETEWEAKHPGETPGPVLTARMQDAAWAFQRPGKKPADLEDEQWWRQELREAGYEADQLQRPDDVATASLDDLSVQQVASRALDRCAAVASTWTSHSVREHLTRITTEAGVQATPADLHELIDLATGVATGDCFSVLPPGMVQPEHVADLTSLGVVAAQAALRDRLAAAAPGREPEHPDVADAAQAAGLDAGQTIAATAVASTDPLVIVEGAAGAGKTTMLGVAIEVAREQGRASRMIAPTLRAAQVAHEELGVPATSVAALVYAHGWRWNEDGVWTRLAIWSASRSRLPNGATRSPLSRRTGDRYDIASEQAIERRVRSAAERADAQHARAALRARAASVHPAHTERRFFTDPQYDCQSTLHDARPLRYRSAAHPR